MRTIIASIIFLTATVFAQAQKVEIPKAVIEKAFADADCSVSIENALENLEASGASGDLGNGLKLVELSCWNAAYNFGSIMFVFDPGANPARFRVFPPKKKKA